MKYLILGVDGMLGHVLFERASQFGEVKGTSRRSDDRENVFKNIEASNLAEIQQIIENYCPDVVVNCIGVIKQLNESKDPIVSIKINSLFPHELSVITRKIGSHLIHLSTDCVFRGDKGNYQDDDIADAVDLYGRTKFLGEVSYEKCLTLRTSIIGHELDSNRSLVDWFLIQKDSCKGFKHAIYSGFPTITLANVILGTLSQKMVQSKLSGVYNLSSDHISKYELLKLVARVYGKKIDILPETDFRIDRSLDSNRLRRQINFNPVPWEQMVKEMHSYFIKTGYSKFKKEYSLESL